MNDYEKSIPSTNEINTKYKMQSHIPHTFIIVMDFYVIIEIILFNMFFKLQGMFDFNI